jgi:hypothetical protein
VGVVGGWVGDWECVLGGGGDGSRAFGIEGNVWDINKVLHVQVRDILARAAFWQGKHLVGLQAPLVLHSGQCWRLGAFVGTQQHTRLASLWCPQSSSHMQDAKMLARYSRQS